MCSADELAVMRQELDLLNQQIADHLRDKRGGLVRKLTVRGRDVEYVDAIKHRESLWERIKDLERYAGQARGSARNQARVMR